MTTETAQKKIEAQYHECALELFQQNIEDAKKLHKAILSHRFSSPPLRFLFIRSVLSPEERSNKPADMSELHYALKTCDDRLLAAMEKGNNPFYQQYKAMKEYAESNGIYGSVLLNFSDSFCSTFIVMVWDPKTQTMIPAMASTIDFPYPKLGQGTIAAYNKDGMGAQLPGQMHSLRFNGDGFSAALHVPPFNIPENLEYFEKNRHAMYWPLKHVLYRLLRWNKKSEALHRAAHATRQMDELVKRLGDGCLTPAQALDLAREKCHGYKEVLDFLAEQKFAHDSIIPIIGTKEGEGAIVEIVHENGKKQVIIRHFGENPTLVDGATNIAGNGEILSAFNMWDEKSPVTHGHFCDRLDSKGRTVRSKGDQASIINTIQSLFDPVLENKHVDSATTAQKIGRILRSVINDETRLFFGTIPEQGTILQGFDLPRRHLLTRVMEFLKLKRKTKAVPVTQASYFPKTFVPTTPNP